VLAPSLCGASFISLIPMSRLNTTAFVVVLRIMLFVVMTVVTIASFAWLIWDSISGHYCCGVGRVNEMNAALSSLEHSVALQLISLTTTVTVTASHFFWMLSHLLSPGLSFALTFLHYL